MERNTKKKLISILQQKCPICGKGDVYNKQEYFFQLPVMKENCESCHYHYDREPGYFLGAMYVSYGLAVFQGIAAFLISIFLFDGLSPLVLSLIVVSVIVVFSLWNYKLSRVIWMNIFPN